MNARLQTPILILSTALTLPAYPVNGSLISFDYTGTVRSIVFLGGATDTMGFEVGQTVTGSVVFDDTAADTDLSSDRAYFQDSIVSFDVGEIGTTASEMDLSSLSINSTLTAEVSAYANSVYDDGDTGDVYSLAIKDTTATVVIESEGIDLTALALGDFDQQVVSFRRTTGLQGSWSATEVQIDIESLEITSNAVPEPSTLAIWCLLSVTAGGIRGWRLRQATRSL